ncbi:hypothetical protein ONZ45_g6608 [Pleurotus djamor]|nr:hypothetical protein ONZ45_g6608 [Pleurotus djamor]
MSLSFGGVAVLSSRSHASDFAGFFLDRSHIKSIFCLLIFVIVVVLLGQYHQFASSIPPSTLHFSLDRSTLLFFELRLLTCINPTAYLTNPTETSFRAYLTEQSFRLHLSHLDDYSDEKQQEGSDSNKLGRFSPTTDITHRNHIAPFHFSKRAAVSLRTPKHVFHNFGVFTIAAMVPLDKGSRTPSPGHHFRDRDTSSLVADSWYIGAFGRWWRGGIIEAWYRDLIARSSDEESWSSGILGMRSLDQFPEECNALPFAAKLLPCDSPPKNRGRGKQSQPGGGTTAGTRSRSPPPLPYSATLPLHTTRQDPVPLVIPTIVASPVAPAQLPPQLCDPTSVKVEVPNPISRTSSTSLFDQSPLIAEVLHQISEAKVSVQDLRVQLNDHQNGAMLSHSALQSEVVSLREKKREEDSARSDLKSRTKALEDSKRSAESSKRDVEKRLKMARTAQDDLSRRVTFLAKDIGVLHQQHMDDEEAIKTSKRVRGHSDQELEISEAIEEKRKEIKVAEDALVVLGLKAKQLEEKISNKKARLNALKTRVEIERQTSSVPHPAAAHRNWSISQTHISASSHAEIPVSSAGLLDPEPTFTVPDGLPYLNGDAHAFLDDPTLNGSTILGVANGVSDVAGVGPQTPHATFSPFNDFEATYSLSSPYEPHSPITPGLIPSGLMSTLDSSSGLSRSFQSESDVIIEKSWRQDSPDSPPMGIHGHHVALEQDPHSSMVYSPTLNHGYPGDEMESSYLVRDHHLMPIPQRTYSDPPSITSSLGPAWDGMVSEGPDSGKFGFPRRWFSLSSKEKPKKGLNPDAKAFNFQSNMHSPDYLPNPVPTLVGAHSKSFDILNPNGLSSTTSPLVRSSTSLLSRAFAPSRQEREALQRALGSSSNNSLERLPSLSDVGSIPSSPTHHHATAVALTSPPGLNNGLHDPLHQVPHRSFSSWLQSLPRGRKTNFSPWDDDDATPVSDGRGASTLAA